MYASLRLTVSVDNFINANTELGIDFIDDLSSGTNAGTAIPLFSLSAANQSRYDARTAYLSSAIQRSNLHIATERIVTGLIINEQLNSSDLIAQGVQVGFFCPAIYTD